MSSNIRVRVKHRVGTKQQWETNLSSEVLLNGEIAFVRDADAGVNYFKVGDGSKQFCQLPYVTSPQAAEAGIVVGTRQEWAERAGFQPGRGQVVVWLDNAELSSGVYAPGLKIGDGNAYNIDLPFVGQDVAESALSALAVHIASDVHLKDGERAGWNHKISVGDIEDPNDDGVRGETLVITRN